MAGIKITRLTPDGYGGRRNGSFAGKTAAVSCPIPSIVMRPGEIDEVEMLAIGDGLLMIAPGQFLLVDFDTGIVIGAADLVGDLVVMRNTVQGILLKCPSLEN